MRRDVMMFGLYQGQRAQYFLSFYSYRKETTGRLIFHHAIDHVGEKTRRTREKKLRFYRYSRW